MLFFCLQYLIRNGITEISRDNFSFSTKIKVGDFYEAREGPEVKVSTFSCVFRTDVSSQ